MIARTWHGVTPSAKADAYVDYLYATGVPDLEATSGNRGAWVLRRREGERSHFWLISLWDSEEAIRRFAGDEPDRARYYPEDGDYLLELEPTVTHYEVCEGPAAEGFDRKTRIASAAPPASSSPPDFQAETRS